jgi:hypothetical protein
MRGVEFAPISYLIWAVELGIVLGAVYLIWRQRRK